MRSLLSLAALCMSAVCAAADADVQRQLMQREQNQAELRLKMQQQQERATNPPRSPAEDFQRRTIERDQQQRMRELQARQSREEIAPTPALEVQREVERQRAAQATAEELKRLERERVLEVERNRLPQP